VSPYARSSGSRPTATALSSISVPKREPSSSLKNATMSGRRVVTFAALSVFTTSSAPSTPRQPPKRPAVATESMCEPAITGFASSSRPLRRP